MHVPEQGFNLSIITRCSEYINHGIEYESGRFAAVIFHGVESFEGVIELVGFDVAADDAQEERRRNLTPVALHVVQQGPEILEATGVAEEVKHLGVHEEAALATLLLLSPFEKLPRGVNGMAVEAENLGHVKRSELDVRLLEALGSAGTPGGLGAQDFGEQEDVTLQTFRLAKTGFGRRGSSTVGGREEAVERGNGRRRRKMLENPGEEHRKNEGESSKVA